MERRTRPRCKRPSDTLRHLTGLLRYKRALIIIDNAWNLEAVDAFRVGGPACKTIITIRNQYVSKTKDHNHCLRRNSSRRLFLLSMHGENSDH